MHELVKTISSMVWSLETLATQNLAFDARRPIRKLNRPQLTETVVFMNPIEFPLKAEYERINNTFEGMKIRELREPEIDDPRKEEAASWRPRLCGVHLYVHRQCPQR